MNNPQWLELPIPPTKFYGPKDVRAIVRLYLPIAISLFLTTIVQKFEVYCSTVCVSKPLDK